MLVLRSLYKITCNLVEALVSEEVCDIYQIAKDICFGFWNPREAFRPTLGIDV